MVEFLGLGLRAWMHNLRFCVGLFLKLHHARANIFLATIKCNQRSAKIENTLLIFRRKLN
jgi:hypothetical protein